MWRVISKRLLHSPAGGSLFTSLYEDISPHFIATFLVQWRYRFATEFVVDNHRIDEESTVLLLIGELDTQVDFLDKAERPILSDRPAHL
jgi:hypothetical protein